jgi:hypothetical protein
MQSEHEKRCGAIHIRQDIYETNPSITPFLHRKQNLLYNGRQRVVDTLLYINMQS